MTTYVAPAHKVLTELHRQDPDVPRDQCKHSDGATVCGQPMPADEFWMPVEKRPGDRECRRCAEPGSQPEITEEGLF